LAVNAVPFRSISTASSASLDAGGAMASTDIFSTQFGPKLIENNNFQNFGTISGLSIKKARKTHYKETQTASSFRPLDTNQRHSARCRHECESPWVMG
jgi:hypothetical protein